MLQRNSLGKSSTPYKVKDNILNSELSNNKKIRDNIEKLKKAATKKREQLEKQHGSLSNIENEWVEKIAIDDVLIDESIGQRNALDNGRIEKIISLINNFDPRLLEPISIGIEKGTNNNYCPDGGGRLTVMYLIGFDNIRCYRNEVTKEELADMFHKQNDNKKALGTIESMSESINKNSSGKKLSSKDKKYISFNEFLEDLDSFNGKKILFYDNAEDYSFGSLTTPVEEYARTIATLEDKEEVDKIWEQAIEIVISLNPDVLKINSSLVCAVVCFLTIFGSKNAPSMHIHLGQSLLNRRDKYDKDGEFLSNEIGSLTGATYSRTTSVRNIFNIYDKYIRSLGKIGFSNKESMNGCIIPKSKSELILETLSVPAQVKGQYHTIIN